MKKTSFFKFCLLLAMGLTAAVFNSCSSDGDGSTPAFQQQYFSVEGASFVNEEMPENGSSYLISNVSINGNVKGSVINGGSALLSFESSQPLSAVYVGVVGEKGYFKYDLTSKALAKATDLQQVSAVPAAPCYYEILLLLSQALNVDNFRICLVGVTASGDISAQTDTELIDVVEVGTGKLQVSLSWDQLDDVDLHLFEPDGTEICYWNRVSTDNFEVNQQFMFDFYCYLVNKYTSHNASNLRYSNENDQMTLWGYMYDLPETIDEDAEYIAFLASKNIKRYGELDLDSNPACIIDGINNENITYADNVKSGKYTVAVNLWEKCNYVKPGAKYSVTVIYNGQTVWAKTGQFDDNNEGNDDDDPNRFVTIGTFTISGNTARANAQGVEAALPSANVSPTMKAMAAKVFKK